MLVHAQLNVIGVAHVIRPVGTTKDVDVKRAHASVIDKAGRSPPAMAFSPTQPKPFSLSLSKAITGLCPGFDKLSPNGQEPDWAKVLLT